MKPTPGPKTLPTGGGEDLQHLLHEVLATWKTKKPKNQIAKDFRDVELNDSGQLSQMSQVSSQQLALLLPLTYLWAPFYLPHPPQP